MKFFRIIYKLIALVYLAVTAVFVMFGYSVFSDKAVLRDKQKAYRKKWLQKVVKVIGLKVTVKGELSQGDQSALWVANHISWMDIAVVGSQGVGFLSKSEIRKWPLIGWLGEQSGTVFIQRGGKNASQVAAKAIAEKIHDNDSVLVFPEGTTSTGKNVSRFHARIFAPALDHQLLVQAIAIQYLDDHGQMHPKAVWNDELFFSNLIGVLGQTNIHAVLTILPLVDARNFTERRQLAELVENQIRDIVLAGQALQVA